MIKNIGNSFIGGFFRRLGSIFALFFILALIGYLLKDFDTNDFVNKLLGIQKINASSFERKYHENFYLNNSTSSMPYSPVFASYYYGSTTNTTTNIYLNNSQASGIGISIPTNTDYITGSLYITSDTNKTSNCVLNSDFYQFGSGSTINGLGYKYNYFTCTDNSSSYTYQFYARMGNSGGGVIVTACDVNYMSNDINTSFISYRCPVINNYNILSAIRIVTNNSLNKSIAISGSFVFERDTGGSIIQEQIKTNDKLDSLNNKQTETNNKLNETNNKLDEVKNTLTDNTLNDNDISDELSDLAVSNQSLGFFSTFLTLPLTWVQNILRGNQTCSSLEVPLPFIDKDLTLPCMSPFWQSMGILGTLLQAVWLAVVGVRVFNGLFVITVDSISSRGNADELTKIRSWEL